MDSKITQTVLITGGSGLIGSALTQRLANAGHKVRILSRSQQGEPLDNHASGNFADQRQTSANLFYWNPNDNYVDIASLREVDTIVHLSGKNIGNCRWTKRSKLEFVASRVNSANLLFDTCVHNNLHPKTFITASGIGYYPMENSKLPAQENDSPESGFMSQLCQDWEQAAVQFESLGSRVCRVRTGFVLASKGINANNTTAFDMMALPHKFGVGMNFGSGKQILSWIHLDDLVDIYRLLIENSEFRGAFNAVAPVQDSLDRFNREIAAGLRRPFWLTNLPEPMVKLLMGEMAEVLVKGTPVSAEKILSTGFAFKYQTLKKAVENLLQ